jgi:hypothetical protein
MRITIINLTKKQVKEHSNICEEVLRQFPELERYYETILVALVDDLSISIFKKRVGEILGVANQDVPMPSRVSSAFAKGGQGVLTVRVDMFGAKSLDLRDFIVHEECCHLIDYEGDSKPKSNTFWQMWERYKLSKRPDFGERIMRELSMHFNHFNVNRLLAKHDLKQWLSLKKDYYGMKHRSKFDDFCKSIESKYDGLETLTIILAEMIKVISFLSALLSIQPENLCSTQREMMSEMDSSIRNTISIMESHAKAIHYKMPPILSWFNPKEFGDEDTFFFRVNELWNLLDLLT